MVQICGSKFAKVELEAKHSWGSTSHPNLLITILNTGVTRPVHVCGEYVSDLVNGGHIGHSEYFPARPIMEKLENHKVFLHS